MAFDEVSIVIRAKDLASRVFQKVGKAIEINTHNVRQLARGLTYMAVAAAGAVAAMMKMISRGSELLNVQRAFNNIAGGEGVEALQKLRNATQGLVTDYELMKNANQAVSLGAVDTIEGFAEMASLAQGLGRAFGITATEALEKFTVGLARMSKLRLDDLGIVIDVEKANQNYAKSLGISTAALSDNQKAIAFRSAAMAEANRIVSDLGTSGGNAADAVGRLVTAVKNTFDNVSLLIAQAPGVTAFFEAFAEGAQNMATMFTGTGEQIREAFEILGVIAWNGFAVGLNIGFKQFFTWVEKLGFGGIFQRIADVFESSMLEATENIKIALRELAVAADAVQAQMPSGGGGGAAGGGGGAGGGGLVDRLSQLMRRTPVIGNAALQGVGTARFSVAQSLDLQMINRRAAALDELSRAQDESANATEMMATTVINTFSQMAASVIANSKNIWSTIVGGAASIAGAAVGIANPAAGAAIAAGGGLLSGILSRGPAPVRVDSYGPTAINQQRDMVQPINFTAILRMDGTSDRVIQQRLYQLTRQDASPRILVPIVGGGA